MTSFATASDGVRLHVEDTSEGTPIVFVHEFGGDQRSWEPQVRFFSRRYRCVTFNARGYPPSDVPDDMKDAVEEQPLPCWVIRYASGDRRRIPDPV